MFDNKYDPFIKQLDSRIQKAKLYDLSENQSKAVKRAENYLDSAYKATNRIDFYKYLNLARVEEAYFTPDHTFQAFIESELLRDKGRLDKRIYEGWMHRLRDLLDEVKRRGVTLDDRDVIAYFLEQHGRKWASHNAQIEVVGRALFGLTVVAGVTLALALRSLGTTEALFAALFGAIGGLLSSVRSMRRDATEFRSWWLDLTYLLIRPLTGSIVAVVFLQFLQSNLSPITVNNWQSTPSNAAVAAISFAAGFSERFVLGRLRLDYPDSKD